MSQAGEQLKRQHVMCSEKCWLLVVEVFQAAWQLHAHEQLLAQHQAQGPP